ncbi:MAG: hypothetical protein ACLFP8_08700 [Alphaproteobacteria bacterium]
MKKEDKQEKRAAALRDNLKRRKEKMREITQHNKHDKRTERKEDE